MRISIKPIDAVVLAEALSITGRYKVFPAQHWIEKNSSIVPCYDVGAVKLHRGQVTRQHFLSKEEAVAKWEDFRGMMTHGSDEGYRPCP